MSERTTYLLIDGENIDATLGTSILQRRPQPDERPRWKRLLSYLEDRWDQPVKGLFFLAIDGEIPIPFVQALTALGFQPIMLRGEGKVVDIGIQRTAEALLGREDDVVLVSHDADFAPSSPTSRPRRADAPGSWASRSSSPTSCAASPGSSSSTWSTRWARSTRPCRACA